MLVIVEDGNLHRGAQGFLDLEAVGSLDVFEIDAAKRRFQQLAELDDLFGVVTIHFDVEDVDVGKTLEQIESERAEK